MMSDPDVIPHAISRWKDRRVSIHNIPEIPATHTTRSRHGCALHLPPIIRYGQTLTIEQYRRWETTTTNERNH